MRLLCPIVVAVSLLALAPTRSVQAQTMMLVETAYAPEPEPPTMLTHALVTPGAITLTMNYTATVLMGVAVGFTGSSAGRVDVDWSFVPLVGPFMLATDSSYGVTLPLVLGVGQLVGLTLCILGTVIRRDVAELGIAFDGQNLSIAF